MSTVSSLGHTIQRQNRNFLVVVALLLFLPFAQAAHQISHSNQHDILISEVECKPCQININLDDIIVSHAYTFEIKRKANEIHHALPFTSKSNQNSELLSIRGPPTLYFL